MNQRFCEQCGQPLSAGTKFCEQCGTPVAGSMPTLSPNLIVTPPPTPTVQPPATSIGQIRQRTLIMIGAGILLIALATAGFLERERLASFFRSRTTTAKGKAAATPPSMASTPPATSSIPDAVSSPPSVVQAPSDPLLLKEFEGVFPARPFNGMQMNYKLSGVTVDSQNDQEGFTTSRTLTGKVTGKIFRVTGRVAMQSGISSDIHVRLESGGEKKEIPLSITVGDSKANFREFDLSVPVNSGTAVLVIEMIGSYKAEQRRLLLTGTFGELKTPGDPVVAAQELADMVLWWETQPWVKALRKSMARGVSIGMHADPYNAEGWSEVEVREHHTPDSGFDPNVSPMVGLFRVSRVGRKVEWMEPVSGEYQPLDGFIKLRNLKVGSGVPSSSDAPAEALSISAGNFESEAPRLPDRDAPVIVPDPGNPKNHVARITGPDEMGFTLPASVPEGTQQLTVSLRLLHPLSTKLIKFGDGRMPEGIRLRVRLLNEKGNSAIRDMVVRPTGQWRKMEYVFYELPGKVVQVSVEAIWMNGPVYVDDVKFAR